jgi:hypothetical protein
MLSSEALRSLDTVPNYPANLARTTIMGGTPAEVAALIRHLEDPKLLALAVNKHKNQMVRYAAARRAEFLDAKTRATLLAWYVVQEGDTEESANNKAFERVIDVCSAVEILEMYTKNAKALSALSHVAANLVSARLVGEFSEGRNGDVLVGFTHVAGLISLVAEPIRRVFAGELPEVSVEDLLTSYPELVAIAAVNNGGALPDALAELIAARGLRLLDGAHRLRTTQHTIEILFASPSFSPEKLARAFSSDPPMIRAILNLDVINDATLCALTNSYVASDGLDARIASLMTERLDGEPITSNVVGAIGAMFSKRRAITTTLALRMLDVYLENADMPIASTSSERVLTLLMGGGKAITLDTDIDFLAALEEVCERHGRRDSFDAALPKCQVTAASPWFESWIERVSMRDLPTDRHEYLELIAERINAAAGEDERRWDMVAALLPSWEGTLPTFAAIIADLDVSDTDLSSAKQEVNLK